MIAPLLFTVANLAPGVQFVPYREPNFVYEQDLNLTPSHDGINGQQSVYFPVTDPGPIRLDIRGDLQTAKGVKIPGHSIPYLVSAAVKDASDTSVFDRKFNDLSLQSTFLASGRMSKYYVPNSPKPAGDWSPGSLAKWSVWKLMLFAPPSPLSFRGKLKLIAPAYGYELLNIDRVDQDRVDLGVLKGQFSTKNLGYYEISAEFVFDTAPKALSVPCTVSVRFGNDPQPVKSQTKTGVNRLYLRSVAGGEHPNVTVVATIEKELPHYHCRLRIRRFPFRPQRIASSGAAFEAAGP